MVIKAGEVLKKLPLHPLPLRPLQGRHRTELGLGGFTKKERQTENEKRNETKHMLYVVRQSLEVKLPTWTDEKQR